MPGHVPYLMSIPSTLPFPVLCALLGQVLALMYPERVKAILRGELSGAPTRLEKLLVAGIFRSHQLSNNLASLTPIYDAFWQADSATDYHQRVAARFDSVFLPHHANRLLAAVGELRRSLPAASCTFCEIGCGSGRMLEFFSARLPEVDRFVGIDLSPAQIARNQSHYAGSSLQFVAADGLQWLLERQEPGVILFVYGGVLEYFPPAKLQRLLDHLARALHPCGLVLVEPLAEDHDLGSGPTSRLFGHENTWSHDYPALCRAAGLVNVAVQDHRIGPQRWLHVVAKSCGSS